MVSPTGRAWEWGNALYGISTEQGGVASTTQYITGAAIFLDIPSGTSINNNWILKSITKGTQIDFKEGYYYKTTISFNITGSDGWGTQLPQLNRLVMPSNSPYKLVNVAPDTIQCFETGVGSGQVSSVSGSGGQIWNETYLTGCQRGYVSYNIVVQATESRTASFQIGDGAQWMFEAFVPRNMSGGAGAHSIRFGTLTPLAITEYKPDDIGQINAEQQQAGEQAQQDGQTGADSSQSQAQQGGQTLLQGFSSFVGALTSASASNCVINGNIGNFEMGNMDLCQLSPPPAFQAISSIMVIGFVVPLSIATIRKFIGMFRSFQNG